MEQELEEVRRRLKESEAACAELQTQAEKAQAAAEAAKNLKSELAAARKEAKERKVATDKANTDLKALKTTSKGLESRVNEVETLLQDASTKFEALEVEKKKQDLLVTELTKSAEEERTNARQYQQELKIVEDIAAGVFSDLPKSLADAQAFAPAPGDRSFQKEFWDQFGTGGRTPLLADQMKQLMELHRVGGPALQDLSVKLWPTEALPTSYFGLLRRLVDAPTQVDAWKRSACIEGTQQAFAHFKMQVPVLSCDRVAIGMLPEGKPNQKLEKYMEDALKGAIQIEKICSKDSVTS